MDEGVYFRPVEATNEQPLTTEPAKPDPLLLFQIKELESQVKGYEAKISDIREYVKKMESEMDQIRIRSQRDIQKNIDQSAGNFFKSLLPVVDNFERSLKMATADDAFFQGIRLIHQQLGELLKQSGLLRIATKGETFDPRIHEAIATVPVESEEDGGRVIEEVKAGYQFKDVIVRPAQVIVSASKVPD